MTRTLLWGVTAAALFGAPWGDLPPLAGYVIGLLGACAMVLAIHHAVMLLEVRHDRRR